MPATVDDYDKNDEDKGDLSDIGMTPAQSEGVGSATGAPKQATPEKQQSDGYVPWSSFVDANKDVSDREAGKLAGQVQGDVSKAQGDLASAQAGYDAGNAGNYSSGKKQSPNTVGTVMSSEDAFPTQEPAGKTSKPSDSANPPAGGSTGYGPSPSSTTAAAPTGRTPTATYSEPTGPRQALNGALPPNGAVPPPPNAGPGGRAPAQGYTPPSNPTAPPSNTQQEGGAAAPWSTLGHQAASLAPNAAAAGPTMAAKTAPTAGVPGVLEQYGRSQALAPGAANKAANGPKDLEQSLGEAKWNSLLGETTKAQQEANALGSESGVQGLLQQGQSSPEQNTAFDAALINGQGGPQFRDLAQKYGGNQLEQGVVNADQKAQDAWKQLQGDVDARAAWDASAKGPAGAGSVSQLSPTGVTAGASGYDPSKDDHQDHSLDDVRTQNSAGWNAVSAELGFLFGPNGDGNTSGADWVKNLGSLEATGMGQPGSLGVQITQAVGNAEKSLGMSQNDFYSALSKMSPRELGDFWALGVIPQWMNVQGGYGKGVPGGWQSPYIQQTLSYGNDGGMWNAILNMWKTGASTVAAGIPVVGGAASAGIKAAPVNTYQNKYGKQG
jgi:hypothetical protein